MFIQNIVNLLYTILQVYFYFSIKIERSKPWPLLHVPCLNFGYVIKKL